MGKKQSNGQVVAPQNKGPKKKTFNETPTFLFFSAKTAAICVSMAWVWNCFRRRLPKKKTADTNKKPVDVNAASIILQHTTGAEVTITLSSLCRSFLHIFAFHQEMVRANYSHYLLISTYNGIFVSKKLQPHSFCA